MDPIMTTQTDQEIITASASCSSNPPILPSLYFAEKDQSKNNNDSIDNNNGTQTSFTIEPLPSEVLCTITSYLDWGDFARLSVTNKSFQSIVHDAATLSHQKWDLAMALLNGTNGLQPNSSLAMKYLYDLAGVQVSKEEFNPSYEGMKKQSRDETQLSNATDLEAEIELTEEERISTTAMRKLAMCFLEGNGVEKDLALGLAWLKTAHYHGDIEAAYETAITYEYSKYGVEVDIYHAAEWFLGAANAGHVESMAEYAMCLELGCGVEQSDDDALDWYTKAANRGHVTSNFSVGEMFEQARGGLPQSDSEAVLWYYKAAMMGDEDSKIALKRLNDIARIVLPGWASTLNEQARGTR